MQARSELRSTLAAGAALAALCLLAFLPTLGNGFVSFDDPAYITENAHVQQGLSIDGVRWAFTSFHAATWHPLTWLSHMLDVTLFGMNPAAHHAVSLVLHIAAALLLYAALLRMTHDATLAVIAAMLFALHPLRVESVAWAAERKDVLCAFFWMLCLWLYAGEARSEKPRLIGVTFGFIAGLLAKPMMITLPFALLLLDRWPLNRMPRFDARSVLPLLREKALLFALVAATTVVTYLSQQWGDAVVDWQSLSITDRLANSALACARYLGSFLWPVDLAVLYPLRPEALSLSRASGAAVLLLAVTAGAWRLRDTLPVVLSGWLWFVGTLVPVIGLVQIGNHSHADRFTYIPSVGLCLIVGWFVSKALATTTGARRVATGIAAAFVVVGLAAVTHAQTRRWQDSVSLYEHTLAATEGNYVIHTNLGIERARAGDLPGALQQIDAALAINPDYARGRNNRGNVLMSMRRVADAEGEYRRAVALDLANPKAHNNLALALMHRRQWDEAIGHLRDAVRLEPSYVGAWNNLGIALASSGQLDEARQTFERVLELQPGEPQATANLARLRAMQAR